LELVFVVSNGRGRARTAFVAGEIRIVFERKVVVLTLYFWKLQTKIRTAS